MGDGNGCRRVERGFYLPTYNAMLIASFHPSLPPSFEILPMSLINNFLFTLL
jgi:hypothetical protein